MKRRFCCLRPVSGRGPLPHQLREGGARGTVLAVNVGTAMREDLRIWTTVGSAGTLNATDLAKVGLDKAVISLGHGIAPPAASAAEESSIGFPTTSVVVRYNVTPVAGLFPAGRFHYVLQFTYKGTVRARLGQFSVLTNADTDVLHFDSSSSPPAHTFTTASGTTTDDSAVLDFVNCAYYVEATLTASAVIAGNQAAIAAVKIIASPDFSG